MIFKILAFFTTAAGIGMGLKTGWDSYKNAEEKTVRFGANRTQINNGKISDLVVTCLLHCFGWAMLFTLPVYVLQKIWWVALIIIAIGVVIYLLMGKKSSSGENEESKEE